VKYVETVIKIRLGRKRNMGKGKEKGGGEKYKKKF
jgi:hypothetical protein